MYYLKTRYYDPEVGRFITIDDISYLAPDTINGLNLYAYCGNNPVMRVDHEGTSWWSDFWNSTAGAIFKVVIGSVVIIGLGVATIFTLGAAAPITGLAATFITGAFVGALSGAVFGAISGGLTYTNGKIGWSWHGAADGFMRGSISGAITGALSAGLGKVSEIAAVAKLGKIFNYGLQIVGNAMISSTATLLQGLIKNEFSWVDITASLIFGGMSGGFYQYTGINNILMGISITSLDVVFNMVYEAIKSILKMSAGIIK